jgi:SAM-dependent methyltransferase
MGCEPRRAEFPTSGAWADEAARWWLPHVDRLDAQLAPVSDLLLTAAAISAGERVLDVGCGHGSTTRLAAAAAGATGAVMGVDISPALIDAARAQPGEGAPIEWVVADAQRAILPSNFDVVLSRFGTLFFDDPVAAFANLAAATRPGGRIAMAVWQEQDQSPAFQTPHDLAVRAATEAGYSIEPSPGDEGPFALGVPGAAQDLLEHTGWAGVSVVPHVIPMYLFGPASVEEVVAFGLNGPGPVRRVIAHAPDEVVDAVGHALTTGLTEYHDGTGVRLDGAIAIVTGYRHQPSQ